MSEGNPKTFRETPLSDDNRQSIVSVLKKEGFSEEQLNVMPFEKVWQLYVDSFSKIMSNGISEMARVYERNPQLASMLNPLIEKLKRELEDLADFAEKELDKKKEKKP